MDIGYDMMNEIRSGCHTGEKRDLIQRGQSGIILQSCDALYLRSKSPCAAHGPLMNMVPGRQHYSSGQTHGQFYDNQYFGL